MYIAASRYKSPYSHQQYLQTNREDKYYTPYTNASYQQTQLNTHSPHDPLGYTASLPMSSQESPGVKYKIDYWEYHTTANAKPAMNVSKSLEKLTKKSLPELLPPPDNNRHSLNLTTTSRSFRNAYHSESNTSAYQRDYTKGMQPPSDEGTPV